MFACAIHLEGLAFGVGGCWLGLYEGGSMRT